ncbi:hypothetical protein [Austwickia chelonae]|nr:hypothetical protein [Austwickia chelonae]
MTTEVSTGSNFSGLSGYVHKPGKYNEHAYTMHEGNLRGCGSDVS